MELREAMMKRKSIRGYLDRPVPQEDIREILKLATRSISGENTQPWEIYVVTGEVIKKIAKENAEDFRAGKPNNWNKFPITGVWRRRQVDLGKALLGSMGVERHDMEKRAWWNERGFRFFDAPTGIVLAIEDCLEVDKRRFDFGALAQSICLAAMEFGVSTCVAAQPVMYETAVRKYLGIPDHQILIYGIAMGYADPDFPANNVPTPREDVDTVTKWFGFD